VTSEIDYDSLSDALRRCGASWDAAQAHGLLCGKFAVDGLRGGAAAIALILEGTDAADALRAECESLLADAAGTAQRALAVRMSEFSPLLPDDSAGTATRTEALAHWAEGYLHGLVAGEHGDALKQRLAAEPVADIVKDMLQITRAGVDESADSEEEEKAYAEVVEYLRVAAQLIYEELAELRPASDQ
jgi:uncharacterized protein YgfB (UPF0149 family)